MCSWNCFIILTWIWGSVISYAGMDMPARAINRNCLDLMSVNCRFATAIEKLVVKVTWMWLPGPYKAILGQNIVISNEFSLTKEPKSNLEFSKSANIQKTIPLRYVGLEGRQITGFQFKIRNPWRYKVWPYRLRHYVLFCLSVYPGNRAFFWPAMNILLETHLCIHNTTTLSVLHLISFWVVRIDYCATVGGRGKLHRDPRKTSAANRIAGSRLHRSWLAEEVITVTPACSTLLLAPVYVSKSILSYKTINCAQI